MPAYLCERWHSLQPYEWIHEPCINKSCSSRLQVCTCTTSHFTGRTPKWKVWNSSKKKNQKGKTASRQRKVNMKIRKIISVYIVFFSFFFTFLINPHLYAMAIETVSTRKVEYNLIYWPSSCFHFHRLFFFFSDFADQIKRRLKK